MSEQPEQRTRDYLASLFQGQQRAVLAFSGGKDSLVVADLCRPYKDRITLAWVNTGAMFPQLSKAHHLIVPYLGWPDNCHRRGSLQRDLRIHLVPLENKQRFRF